MTAMTQVPVPTTVSYADNDAQRLTDEGQDLVYEVRIDLLRC